MISQAKIRVFYGSSKCEDGLNRQVDLVSTKKNQDRINSFKIFLNWYYELMRSLAALEVSPSGSK